MQKLILFLIVFISINSNAQFVYSLKVEPFAFNKEDGKLKAFQFYNLQFSIKSKADSVFFYEIQPGVIFNGFTPNIGLYLGSEYSKLYFKAGVLYYLSISGGGHSGQSIDGGFLPGIGAGFFVRRNIFFEVSYMLAFATIGIGINL